MKEPPVAVFDQGRLSGDAVLRHDSIHEAHERLMKAECGSLVVVVAFIWKTIQSY